MAMAGLIPNPLETSFNARVEGPGIWKWRHYFDIYHRHLNPLRRRDVLPRMRPGGVYICEDVHGQGNTFAAFVSGLADQLNGTSKWGQG